MDIDQARAAIERSRLPAAELESLYRDLQASRLRFISSVMSLKEESPDLLFRGVMRICVAFLRFHSVRSAVFKRLGIRN